MNINNRSAEVHLSSGQTYPYISFLSRWSWRAALHMSSAARPWPGARSSPVDAAGNSLPCCHPHSCLQGTPQAQPLGCGSRFSGFLPTPCQTQEGLEALDLPTYPFPNLHLEIETWLVTFLNYFIIMERRSRAGNLTTKMLQCS